MWCTLCSCSTMTLKRSSSSSLFRSANCAHCFDAPAEALRRESSRVNWSRQLKGSSVAAMVVGVCRSVVLLRWAGTTRAPRDRGEG